MESSGTLYELADEIMRQYIKIYLELVRRTQGFVNLQAEHLEILEERVLVLGGTESPLDPVITSSDQVVEERLRMQAVPFDVEQAITKGVYIKIRARVAELVDQLYSATEGFTSFDAVYISRHAYLLPILQRLANISSKAEL